MTDILKSICEQCIHINNPQLDFIPANLAKHKEIILRDLQELTSAASLGLEKTVVILSGSIFEAVLYSFLQGQEPFIARRRGEFRFNPEHSLQNYVDIFNRWFRDQLPNARLPDEIVDNRDLIHINRELNLPSSNLTQVARSMLETLEAFLGELATYEGISQ